MIVFRPFLNTDPPQLAAIWRSLPPLRGRAARVDAAAFERYVFAKPYFEHAGLIVAEEQGRCVGFTHAGFGPDETHRQLSYRHGAISVIAVEPREDAETIAEGLRERAEAYLRRAGAQRIVAGGCLPVVPFYVGFYGGSRFPGLLAEDTLQVERFRRAGYVETGRVSILQRRLSDFRPLVDRQQMTHRRSHQVIAAFDPLPDSWWEACTLGWSDRIRFTLLDKESGGQWGQVTFWDMEPLASCWGVRAMGLYDLRIDDRRRREGRATYLVGESLRQLAAQAIDLVEVQIRDIDSATVGLFRKLGFAPVGEGVRLEWNA